MEQILRNQFKMYVVTPGAKSRHNYHLIETE
jgi:hypothetical protein